MDSYLPQGYSAMWNAISLVQDLNSCRCVPFPTMMTITPRAPPYNEVYSVYNFEPTVNYINNLAFKILQLGLKYYLWKFVRWNLIIVVIENIRTILFILIVLLIPFWPIRPPAFFRCFIWNTNRWMHRLKLWMYKNEYEDNSPNILSDKLKVFTCPKLPYTRKM